MEADTVRILQRSFAGGELSPEMFGRIDDVRYQTGLALCRNFIAKAQGLVDNRAGFAFVRAVKDSSKKTRLIPFTFSTTQTMVIELGAGYFRFHTAGATLMSGGSPYEISNPYAEADLFGITFVQSADVLTLCHPNYAPRELRRLGATNWTLTAISFSSSIAAPTSVTATHSGSDVTYSYNYVVTAVASDGSESVASSVATTGGNLFVTGAYNTISWGTNGAVRYNVYKMSGGMYGYIGSAEVYAFKDENIAPDMSITPPLYEAVFASSGNYPAAVSYYEQRRAFAGTTNAPQNFWMTRSGTESAMSYSLPLRDSDRISIRVAAREANTIRHIVPLSQLVLLTSAAEWCVTSVNSDAITPNTISVKPQSYIGAGLAQPVIVNNSMLYAAARGGHVQECSYNWQANGFTSGDVSIRSAHLFDGYDIVDMAYSKAPQKIVWMVSTSGKLLGLTYVPEQQVGAWHQHDTIDGVFESCTAVAEGNEDVLYVVVKRLVNGSYVRYVERQASRAFTDPADAFFVDSGMTFDGTNTGSTTMTVSGGSTWGPADLLTVTASSSKFTGVSDEGDCVVLYDSAGDRYLLKIVTYTSATVVKARVNKTLPAALRNAATTSWAFARNTISGLDHLEGETVSALADGAVSPQKVVTSGTITLDNPAVVVQAGLPIEADIQTLPVVIQIDGFGQGRTKNVNRVWLRVNRSSGIWVGPDENSLVLAKQRTTEPYGSPPALKSEEIEVVVKPDWTDSGQLFARQADPLPLSILAITYEVTIGG